MIISRTPFRMSFFGGGTDLPEFFEQEEGAVLSTTIDKYMHITVNQRFDETFRLSYSRTEIAESVEQIEHPIFRSILKRYNPLSLSNRGLELISMADIPSGTGLGSSCSFTVGCLNAVRAFQHKFSSAEELAKEAYDIERNELKEPIGKQDIYAAAFGGLRLIRFFSSGEVTTEPIVLRPSVRNDFEQSVQLYFTGKTRSASNLLREQGQALQSSVEGTSKFKLLREMRQMAFHFKSVLESSAFDVKECGQLLDQGWKLKKEMSGQISNSEIDQAYLSALSAGATGGKILGAGGGGFLMLLVEPSKQLSVQNALKYYRKVPVRFESRGTHILFVD